MGELRALARHVAAARTHGPPLALATVVETTGSTYRRPGARLLFAREGRSPGLLSGGWLEAALHPHARVTLATGGPQLLVFDSRSDDDEQPRSRGADGRIAVLLQRLPRTRGHWLDFVRQRHERRRAVALATVFRVVPGSGLAVGDCIALDSAGTRHGRTAGGDAAAALDAALGETLRTARAHVLHGFGGEGSAALLEFLPPPVRLVVIGAGDDAMPVVAGASALGWDTVVVDPRPACLTAERFPGAELRPGEADGALARFAGDARTAALVMTHDLARDRRALEALARAELAYLGVLGPGARTGRLLGELEAAGVRLRAAERGRLYAPVGLALGAETPPEIAVAILAELVAHFRQGAMRSLRERVEPIHLPVPTRARTGTGACDRTG